MTSFNKGDLVRLKSGGPAMTVDACPGDDSGHSKNIVFGSENVKWTGYCCGWFVGETCVYDEFGEHLLISADN